MKMNKYRKAMDNLKLSENYDEKTIALLNSDAEENIVERGCSERMIPKRRMRLKPVIAFCVALLIIAGSLSGYALAEANEYREAVTFFNDYTLATEGLSRDDIKKVYRDISTGKFEYEKTADVILKSVNGYEIFQQEPTPEDIEGLWNYVNNRYKQIMIPESNDDVTYKYDYIYKYDAGLGFDVFDKTVLDKYIKGEKVWSVELFDFVIWNHTVYEGNIIVYGDTPSWASSQKTFAILAMISENGQLIWKKTADNGFEDESYNKAVCTADGIAVFGKGDYNYLCWTKYDYNGNLLGFSKKEMTGYGVHGAAKLGDGYLVHLRGGETGDLIIKVDSNGVFSESFTYSNDSVYYYITGMNEYNGNIYLSAYSVPRVNEWEENAGGRYDIASILNYIFENEKFDISNEELTKLVREHFTAVFLVCDTQSGVPSEFYSVKGSVGSSLIIDENGRLAWSVESITDTYLSMYTSSYTIGGACYVYRYTFDNTGRLVSQEKTGEVTPFRR